MFIKAEKESNEVSTANRIFEDILRNHGLKLNHGKTSIVDLRTQTVEIVGSILSRNIELATSSLRDKLLS